MLRNRKDTDITRLKGVIRSADESKIQLGHFVTLQNWILSGIAQLRKKRGVQILSSGAVSPSAPTGCSGETGSAGDLSTTSVADPNDP